MSALKKEGAFLKYNITRIDGTEIDKENQYWLLKLDGNGDINHIHASRKAWKTYADEIAKTQPKLAEDILKKLESFEIIEKIKQKLAELQLLLKNEESKVKLT